MQMKGTGSCKLMIKSLIFNRKLNFCMQVRNYNLKFDSTNYAINLYPFYPQFLKKKAHTYQVPQYCIVLAMNFLDKSLSDDQAWKQRKAFTFKFKDMGLLSTVKIRSGKQIVIQVGNEGTKTKKQIKQKIFKIRDIPAEQRVQIMLQQKNKTKKKGADPKTLHTYVPYAQYRVMNKLIQSSLVELSGWKLMMQIQRKQDLSKIDEKIEKQKSIDEIFKK